ncbi:MAG: N-carbamoylputrescine amidase [Candidatus Thermoplasmatota archaeon]|nr:N-carbamoylputrescine amidase [Candidatus Thermoplasmatota archaeon]
MRCSPRPEANIVAAKSAIAVSSAKDVDLWILPELFSNRYVGQFEDHEAQTARLPDHMSLLAEFKEVSKEAGAAVALPFAEVVDAGTCYNSLALIDKSGKVSASYRKVHIPDSEGYREDLYFKPGDLGYVVARLGDVKIGLGICWDQWFPEVSRTLALKGAELLIYPSAIGSELVRSDFDSRPEWELVMRAQAVMNRVFVAAVNRVGQEEKIRFYGGSFVADPWGKVLRRASTSRPETVFVQLDLSQIRDARSFFGFFDTRQPQTYGDLTKARRSRRGREKR